MIRKAEQETTEQFLNRMARYYKREFVTSHAYPTSTTAQRLGKGKTGCYYVSQRKDGHDVVSSNGYDTEAEAEDFLNGVAFNLYTAGQITKETALEMQTDINILA